MRAFIKLSGSGKLNGLHEKKKKYTHQSCEENKKVHETWNTGA